MAWISLSRIPGTLGPAPATVNILGARDFSAQPSQGCTHTLPPYHLTKESSRRKSGVRITLPLREQRAASMASPFWNRLSELRWPQGKARALASGWFVSHPGIVPVGRNRKWIQPGINHETGKRSPRGRIRIHPERLSTGYAQLRLRPPAQRRSHCRSSDALSKSSPSTQLERRADGGYGLAWPAVASFNAGRMASRFCRRDARVLSLTRTPCAPPVRISPNAPYYAACKNKLEQVARNEWYQTALERGDPVRNKRDA